MKRFFLKVFIVVVIASSVFVSKANAQEIKLGGGMVIETDIPPLGFQFKGTYGLGMLLENLSGSVEFSIFIPSTQNNYKHSRWAIDVDGNYTFWNSGAFDFYAVGGLNITHYAKKSEVGWLSDVIGTKPGLNVGAGVNFGFSSKMSAYSEVKYILSNYDQAVFNVGVLFEL